MKRFIYLLLMLGMMSVWNNQQAKAELINIQFVTEPALQEYSGAAVIGSPGDTWNLIDGSNVGSEVSLVNSLNEAISGATVNSDGIGLGDNSPSSNGFGSTGTGLLMNQFLVGFDHGISFSGLTPNTTYDLYVYSQGAMANENSARLNVQVNGGSTSTTVPFLNSDSQFIEGKNFLKLFATTDATGALSIHYSGYDSGVGYINGIQLQSGSSPTPEPGTMILMGIGGLTVVLFRRKKPASAAVL